MQTQPRALMVDSFNFYFVDDEHSDIYLKLCFLHLIYTMETNYHIALHIPRSPHVCLRWLALWFCIPYIAGSKPAEDNQDYELFGEIALKNHQFFFFRSLLLGSHVLATIFSSVSCCIHLKFSGRKKKML